MEFKKFLEMISEQEIAEAKKKKESTAEKDDKAEKAGKKVAKDIEYDEGHKGKDDKKAEKAGKKVAKDIEYDDKKDKKKKSLKDWIEIVDKQVIAENVPAGAKPLSVLDPTNKQAGVAVVTSKNPTLQKMLGNLDPKEVQVVMTKTAGPAPTTGSGTSVATAMKEEEVEESGLQAYLGKKKYGEKGMKALQKAGREGASKEKMAKIRAQHDKLDEVQIDEKAVSKKQQKFMGMVHAAQKGEKAASPEVAKVAKTMKKSDVKDFAKTKHKGLPEKKKKATEAQIPNSGPDYGAGLGAGRNPNVLEAAKPDFIDLDKDGNKKESMKKAAADKKKKKVKESMNTLEAAYHEGKSHGLSKHGYACRYNEGSEEHRRYHDGFKEGLDECYGLMPNRGLVVGETSPAATVPGMASQAMTSTPSLPAMEEDMDEGNAFTAALANTKKGDTFSVGGKTFTDKSNYDAKIDEFAFESLDKQLNDLLNEGAEVVNEGISVSMSTGNEGSPDTVSVTATDAESSKLLDFIKQVGLGGMGASNPELAHGEPVVAVASDYGAPAFSGHDDMAALMKKVGVDDEKDADFKPEGSDDHEHSESCGCDDKKVDEVETADQREFQVAEDDGEGDIAAYGQEAAINTSMPSKGGATNEDGAEAPGSNPVGQAEQESAEEVDEAKKEEKLDEWANEAGKKGTDAAFERDIEFMTKVISGGLNGPKKDQTTLPHTAVKVVEDDGEVSEWKRLAGLK